MRVSVGIAEQTAARSQSEARSLPALLRGRFRFVILDWDGTAVENRHEDAGPVRTRFEHLLDLGVRIAVVTGTHFGNIDRQLSAAIQSPQKPHLSISTNRGSEVYGFAPDSSPVLLYRRAATADEDHLLTAVAEAFRTEIVRRTGLEIQVVYDRLNRRKLDLIPVPEWADPPKSEIGALRQATDARLAAAGLTGGLREAIGIARSLAEHLGLPDARISSDAKHIEIGLTDKADAASWLEREVARPAGIVPEEILIVGDEFGPVGGDEGSDARMMIPALAGAVVVSVGPEPFGVPVGVLQIGGGPAHFLELLDEQIASWQAPPAP